MNINRLDASSSRGYGILAELRHHGLSMVGLQESQGLDFTTDLIQKLGWRGYHSKCMKAAIIVRSSDVHNVIHSFVEFDRCAIIVHRCGFCFASLYFADASIDEAPLIATELVSTVRRVLHDVRREHGKHFRLLIACDANVELSPGLCNEKGEVTGGGLEISEQRGYARGDEMDVEGRRWREEEIRSKLEDFLGEEGLKSRQHLRSGTGPYVVAVRRFRTHTCARLLVGTAAMGAA